MSATSATLRDWKAGRIVPVYVVHGEEEFLRSEFVQAAGELLISDPGTRAFNFDQLYGSETTLSQVVTIAQGYPMMAERRVVIVREAEKVVRARTATSGGKRGSKGSETEVFLAYLEAPNPDCVLILDFGKFGPKNQSPFKELAAKAAVLEVPAMKERDVVEWVSERASGFGSRLEPSAARLLVGHLGTSLRMQANALEKLLTFASGRDVLTERDVEQVVGASRDYNIFELTKAIGEGRRSAALQIGLRMLASDAGQIHLIFVMVSRYLEQLIIARELSGQGKGEREVAEALELKGGAVYFVKETIAAARRYTRDGLDRAIGIVLESESRSRATAANRELILEQLLLGIMPD